MRDVPTASRVARAPADDLPVGRLRRRLVGLARALTGGLLVLAVAVALLPPVLGDRGPGVGTVVSHVAVALVALGASVVAAGRRTAPAIAVVAGLAVPVLTLVLLLGYWWA